MNPARRRATYQDLIDAPDHMVAEIIDGDLYTSPRPASPHALAASAIGADLFGPFHRDPGDPAGPGGWCILFEPEIHLGADVVVPDVAGWRRTRMPRVPNVAYFEQAPDWVCEVVSPATGSMDRVRKMRIYARERVTHAWLVDPIAKTLEVYRLEGDHWLVAASYGGSDPVRAEPFDAVEVQLGRWWLES